MPHSVRSAQRGETPILTESRGVDGTAACACARTPEADALLDQAEGAAISPWPCYAVVSRPRGVSLHG